MNFFRAKIFYIGQSRSRYNTDIRFNLNDDEFLDFAKSLLEKSLSNINRVFFGIASSRITNETIKHYKKVKIL